MEQIGVPMHTEDVALFSVPPVNVSQDKIMWVEHLPTFGKSGKGTIQFNIPGTGNQYTDLAKTDLYVRLSIKKPNGENFEQDVNTQTAIPINNVLHSLFSMVDVKLNQTLVSTSGTNYMYKAYIENLLNFNEAAKKIQLQMVGFTNEKGNMDECDPDEDPYNYGLLERFSLFKAVSTKYTLDKDGKVALTERQKAKKDLGELVPNPDEVYNDPTSVEFMGPLLADICNQDRSILNGVDIDIKLFPNRDDFRLITFPDGKEAIIEIEDIRLNVCKVSVASETILGIEKVLLKMPAMYPLSRTEVRTFNIPQGSYGDTIEDMFQGEVPSRMIVGMVSSEAYSGSYNTNPFRFQHFNIANLGFYVDGEPSPRAPYEFDFKGGQYIQGLQSVYRVLGKWMENTDIGITRESYVQGNTLFGIDADPTGSYNMSYVGKSQSGRTRLFLRFHKPLSEPVTLIAYAVFPEVMQIDQSRIVCLMEKERAVARMRGKKV